LKILYTTILPYCLTPLGGGGGDKKGREKAGNEKEKREKLKGQLNEIFYFRFFHVNRLLLSPFLSIRKLVEFCLKFEEIFAIFS
jgi:hypothetical protein